jgi:RNA polymerase sigma-70 factor, ECF subfamily
LTATDEADLIVAARSGSTDAFEQLYRAHSARVYGLCLRLSDNQADAQDATQETFIKAWRALGSFRGGSAFSTWLHRIAFNETIGMKRRRKNEHHHLQLVDRDDTASDVALPEVERIERAVAALPDRAREALVLNKIYGYTYKETAEFMEVAVGTCKAQVHRAVRLLRDTMPTMENPSDTSSDMPATGKGRDDE